MQSRVRAAPAEDEYPIPLAFPAGTLLLSIRKSENFTFGSILAITAWSRELADSFDLPSTKTPPFLASVIEASVFIDVVLTEMLSWKGRRSSQFFNP